MSRNQSVSAGLALLVMFPTLARGDLENHYTFDDSENVTFDSSGNDRHGFIDDFDVEWVDDDERGGVLEFFGNTAGFVVAEIPELSGEFTIALWAYRDPDLCCGAGGANDGLFQVQLGDDAPDALLPPSTTTKVIGGWVQKIDHDDGSPERALWGRVITDDGVANSLDKNVTQMEDEKWTHFAYRGDGETFEIVINGVSGIGPSLEFDGTLLDNDTVYIGRQGTETWGGRLDDFRVYSRALSDGEIKEIMGGGGGFDPGDFNKNGMLDANDIDLLGAEIRAGTNDSSFDLDNDSLVNDEDRRVWVEDLRNTYFGDANLDLEFSSTDFVDVFQAGEYEDEIAGNSTWAEGDWNLDTEFTSSDFVIAFQGGGFELGPRPIAAVPEPASALMFFLWSGCLVAVRRRKNGKKKNNPLFLFPPNTTQLRWNHKQSDSNHGKLHDDQH